MQKRIPDNARFAQGVDAFSSHGGKSQEEREYAVKQFKNGKADVLVATDVAAKGLDFPDVQVCVCVPYE